MSQASHARPPGTQYAARNQRNLGVVSPTLYSTFSDTANDAAAPAQANAHTHTHFATGVIYRVSLLEV